VATSLIDELQLDAANAAVSVSSLLRKALIVAAKLELSDVPEWVNKELSGYSDGDSLPSYRIVHGMVKARTLRGWVSVQCPTNDMQEKISEKSIYNSIAEIEALSKRDGRLSLTFPPEAQQLLQDMFQKHTEFRCFFEQTRLDGILDEIRNQVLRWAVALDKAGIRGDGLTFTGAEKEKAHSLVFHADQGTLTIGVVGSVGGRANVATGVQPRAGSIDVDDIQKLFVEIKPHIDSLHLPPTDRQELLTALAELETTKPTKSIAIGKTRQALDRVLGVIGKAGETVLTVGLKTFVEAWMKQHGIAP
jgi:AbiTii